MAGLANTDERDFTDRYNTILLPPQEAAFRQAYPNWMKETRDYDLRGAFLEGLQKDGRGHMSDKYKKPNHPTFSDQSMYHMIDGNIGGRWIDHGNGKFSFIPGSTNMYNTGELQDYFNRVEPGNTLLDSRNNEVIANIRRNDLPLEEPFFTPMDVIGGIGNGLAAGKILRLFSKSPTHAISKAKSMATGIAGEKTADYIDNKLQDYLR